MPIVIKSSQAALTKYALPVKEDSIKINDPQIYSMLLVRYLTSRNFRNSGESFFSLVALLQDKLCDCRQVQNPEYAKYSCYLCINCNIVTLDRRSELVTSWCNNCISPPVNREYERAWNLNFVLRSHKIDVLKLLDAELRKYAKVCV